MTKKILILGGVRAGKTTLARKLRDEHKIKVRHYDDHIKDYSWSDLSQKIADDFLNEPGPWIQEGMSGVRGLRKWLRQNPGKLPDFEIVVLKDNRIPLRPGQQRMHDNHAKILDECMSEIECRKKNRSNKR